MSLTSAKHVAAPAISWLRRYGIVLAVVVLAICATVFVISGRGELADAGRLLASISPIWIGVLAGLQLVVLSVAATTYQLIFKRLGYSLGWFELLEIHLRRVVIGTITPLGGPASLYVFVRSLGQRNVPGCDALITATTRSSMGLVAFFILLVPALLLQRPSGIILIAAGVLSVSLATFLVLGVLLLRGNSLPFGIDEWAPAVAIEFIQTARSHSLRSIDLVPPMLLGAISHVSTATMLYAALHAVGHPASVSTVVIGYVIGKLFFMMAPFFQGVGFVELGMAIALQRAGVPVSAAVGAALMYRVGDLWLPLSWGMLVQVVRMNLIGRFAHGVAFQSRRLGHLGYVLPVRMPGIVRPLATIGHAALATEAILASSVGVWVTFGSPLTTLI